MPANGLVKALRVHMKFICNSVFKVNLPWSLYILSFFFFRVFAQQPKPKLTIRMLNFRPWHCSISLWIVVKETFTFCYAWVLLVMHSETGSGSSQLWSIAALLTGFRWSLTWACLYVLCLHCIILGLVVQFKIICCPQFEVPPGWEEPFLLYLDCNITFCLSGNCCHYNTSTEYNVKFDIGLIQWHSLSPPLRCK